MQRNQQSPTFNSNNINRFYFVYVSGSGNSKSNSVKSHSKSERDFNDGFKVALIGDMGIGKTSITDRICHNSCE